MKKEYISPELMAIRLETMQMMATSSDSLSDLLADDDINIIPTDDPVDEFFSHDDDFDFGSDDDFDFE